MSKTYRQEKTEDRQARRARRARRVQVDARVTTKQAGRVAA